MITKEQREKDKAICEAATPGPWRLDEEAALVYADGGGFGEGFVIAEPEDRADTDFIARARAALPAYIADAEEMERRIADVEAAYKEALVTQDEESALPEGMLLILRILRGEPAADVLRILRGEP